MVFLRAVCRANGAEAGLFRTALRIAVAAVLAVSQGIVTCSVAAQFIAAVDFTTAIDA